DFKSFSLGALYTFTPEADLGFAKIRKFGVNYKNDRQGSKIRLTIESSLGNFPDLDPTNPQSKLPGVTSPGGQVFDLEFLALGQRLPPANDKAPPPANVRQ